MPQKCTVCCHAERRKIDQLVVTGQLANRRIAARYGLAEGAIRRHRVHIALALVRSHEREMSACADDLLEQVQQLQVRALAILRRVERGADTRTALAAIKEARGCMELVARMTGVLREGSPQVTVNNNISIAAAQIESLTFQELEPMLEQALAEVRAKIASGQGQMTGKQNRQTTSNAAQSMGD